MQAQFHQLYRRHLFFVHPFMGHMIKNYHITILKRKPRPNVKMEKQSSLVPGVLVCFIFMVLAKGDFVLIVKLINYTNPTGLCAECETQLDQVNSADQLVPVCCDQSPFTSDAQNCDNTGDASCDTRFRWNIRLFNASLETRPPTVPNAVDPPYFFTDCSLSDMCPFSEKSITFDQGPGGILGVEDNPLHIHSIIRDLVTWRGRIQFFIEAVESRIPNIIDSILVNLDTLQLGADFTEERTYSGYHNISHMTMSFRVECSIGFCGHDCTVVATAPRVQSCLTNGKVLCVQGYDPLEKCKRCLLGRNVSTNCTTCLSGYVEIMHNCVPTATFGPTTITAFSSGAVGGISGGVVGVTVLVALVVTVTICILIRKRTKEKTVETIEMTSNPVYKELDRQHPKTATGETLQYNAQYGAHISPIASGGDRMTHYENIEL